MKKTKQISHQQPRYGRLIHHLREMNKVLDRLSWVHVEEPLGTGPGHVAEWQLASVDGKSGSSETRNLHEHRREGLKRLEEALSESRPEVVDVALRLEKVLPQLKHYPGWSIEQAQLIIPGESNEVWDKEVLEDFNPKRTIDKCKKIIPEALKLLEGLAASPVSPSLEDTTLLLAEAEIDEIFADDLRNCWREALICLESECYNAAIALCGKLLEICIKKRLEDLGAEYDDLMSVGPLLKKLAKELKTQNKEGEYVAPYLNNTANIIKGARNGAVHFKERVPVPSLNEAVGVLSFTADYLNRTFTARGSGE